MRNALGQISTRLMAGEPIPADWGQWLGQALEKIARGVDTDRALELKRASGRPKKIVPLDVAIERGLDGAPAHLEEFPTYDETTKKWFDPEPRSIPNQEELAEHWNSSTRTVQRAEREWATEVRKEREEEPPPEHH